jgi:hypothetical protein
MKTRMDVYDEPAPVAIDPAAAGSCRNCEAPLSGRFCAACGQPASSTHDYSIRHFAEHALHEVTHFDNKLFRTLKPLLFRPGYLTLAFFEGKQQRYMKPLALFVFVNFLFFLFKNQGLFHYTLQSFENGYFGVYLKEQIAASGLSPEVFAAKFNTSMKYQQKGYLIFLVPMLALGLQLLYLPRKRYFVEHLVFSLHFFAFFPIYLTALPLLLMGLAYGLSALGIRLHDNETTLLVATVPVFTAWLYFAIRKFYREHPLLNFLKALLLTLLVLVLIGVVYRLGLFLIVIRTVH